MTTEELEKQEVDESIQLPDLALSDECDRCGFQAYVRVRTNSGDLLFCRRDYFIHEPAIAEAGYPVRDESARAALSSKDIRWEWNETKDRRRRY